jgi:dihydrofolate reductase
MQLESTIETHGRASLQFQIFEHIEPMPNERKLFLFIAMSLDGYIAKPDGDISFLSQVEEDGEDYGYAHFIATVDTVILGRKTYDKICSMGHDLPYGNRNVIVLTRNPFPAKDKITFYSGSLSEIISNLKSQAGLNIYCDGGAETVQQLLKEDLIDEIIVSIIPVILGDGISLFGKGLQQQNLQLVSAESFAKGLVQLHYKTIKNEN